MDEDMAVYRATVDAARKVAEYYPDDEGFSRTYAFICDAFERGDWDLFRRIEDETGGAMRYELRREKEHAALLAEVERLRTENAALREPVEAARARRHKERQR